MKTRPFAGLTALLPATAVVLLIGRVPAACTQLASATAPYPPRLDTLLGAVAVLLAVAATAWLTFLSGVALICRVIRRPVPRRLLAWSPPSWRPVVAAVAGTVVLVAPPASAATTTPGSPGASGASSASGAAVRPPTSAFQGLPLPDRPGRLAAPRPARPQGEPPQDAPTIRTAPEGAPPPARGIDSPSTSVRSTAEPSGRRVRAGETLWSIAADELRSAGDVAGPRRIDRSWRRWYAANRSLIGADPDALRVGLVLRRPGRAPAPDTPSSPAALDEGEPR